eukprot:5175195-Amphidinium_carterae.1
MPVLPPWSSVALRPALSLETGANNNVLLGHSPGLSRTGIIAWAGWLQTVIGTCPRAARSHGYSTSPATWARQLVDVVQYQSKPVSFEMQH